MLVRSWVWTAWVVVAGALPALAQPSTDNSAHQQEQKQLHVDFASQIRPILQRSCIPCHGPEKQAGDLRLDSQEHVDKGGHTGITIIGDTLEDSELYRRITSDEEDYRMPKNTAPLAAEETELIKTWIEQGALWTRAQEPDSGKSPFSFWIWLDDTLGTVEEICEHVRPLKYPFIAVLILILLVERAKGFHRRGFRFTTGRLAPWFRWLARVTPSYYLIAVLLLLISGLWMYHRGRLTESQRVVTELQTRIARITNPVSSRPGTDQGPQPIRPTHPKQLQGTYYRGNDERSERLFNGGFYRTATFRIWICGEDRVPLGRTDQVCGQPLYVAFEITKAEQATESLFSDKIIQSIFLSQQPPQSSENPIVDEPVPLETVAEGKQWVAYYPLGTLEDQPATREGMIYIYQGQVIDGRVSGTIHYGIGFNLNIEEGQLDDESEIWMGCVLVLSNTFVPPEGKIPIHEWFDFRPIPEIVGQNTDDPELLGIPEHLPVEEQRSASTATNH